MPTNHQYPLAAMAAGQPPHIKMELLKAVLVACSKFMRDNGVDWENEEVDPMLFFKEHKLARQAGWRLFKDLTQVVCADQIHPEGAKGNSKDLSRN